MDGLDGYVKAAGHVLKSKVVGYQCSPYFEGESQESDVGG